MRKSLLYGANAFVGTCQSFRPFCDIAVLRYETETRPYKLLKGTSLPQRNPFLI